ncbi:MAG: LmeA family phospholipid-binding protein [Candidatus Sericytochromatia bacterium]
MTAIIAIILSIFMVVGGILPQYSNKTIEDGIKTSFNTNSKVVVKTFKTPSYAILSGDFDRIEISSDSLKVMDIEFDKIKIVGEQIKLDYSKLTPETTNLDFIKKGKADVQLLISSETIAKMIDIPSLTIKMNNMLSNFKLPIPFISGEVSLDNIKIVFENNRPTVTGNLISLGGLITIPFSIAFDLIVTAKNTIEIYKPQVTVMNEPLIIEEIQDLVKYVNPIIDIKTLNKTGKEIVLKNLYFKDNKIKILGTIGS